MKIGNLLSYGPAKELSIPVSYGTIAAKEWGPENGEPVLGLHGWQDNANTFDLVVEHLPDTIRLVVIDLPGHGLSSHLPAGCIYGASQFLVELRRVVNYLRWTKFSFLAHSLGAYVAIYYSAIHPEQIEKLVSIDILYPGMKTPDAISVRMFIDTQLKEEQHEFMSKQHVYDNEFALDLMWQRREGLTKEGAIPLMSRACKETANGVIFTRDHRLKAFLFQPWEFSTEFAVMNLLKNIQADMLVIAASDSTVFKRPGKDLQDRTQDLLNKNCRSYKRVDVEGGHFIHLVNPEKVGPILREFFTNN